MTALADLIQPQSASNLTSIQLAFLALAGFPTTSWQSGSVPVQLINSDSQVQASQSQITSQIALGGLLDTATGPWLALLANSAYGIQGLPGVSSQALATLTDGGGGPFTITPSQLIAKSTTGVQFTNITGGTLPLSGTLQLTWQAISPGTSGNINDNTLTSLSTPLPGVSINNPTPFSLPSSIVIQGANNESDASIVVRCKARWPGLGGGATAPVYKAAALGSTASITRVTVRTAYPTGGQVTVYCAGPALPSPIGDLAIASAAIKLVTPLCVTCAPSNVLPATVTPITLTANVTVKQKQLLAAQSAFFQQLATYQASVQGGQVVYYSALTALIQGLPGVTTNTVITPAVDVGISIDSVPVITPIITWIPIL